MEKKMPLPLNIRTNDNYNHKFSINALDFKSYGIFIGKLKFYFNFFLDL